MAYFKFVVESSDGDRYFSAVQGTSENSARSFWAEHHPGERIISVTQIDRATYRFAVRKSPKRDA